MFGFIKKLFGGITAFLGGIFGGKKSQGDTSSAPKAKKGKGYFMELDDADSLKSQVEAKIPEPVKAAVGTVKGAIGAGDAPKAEPKPEAKKPEPVKATAKKSEAPKQEVPSKNETVKVQAQANPPAPATNGKVESQDELTFAPKYLMPTASNGRRRPGPSMNTFRDMARQVKTPS